MSFIQEKLLEKKLTPLQYNGILASNAYKYITEIIQENSDICDKEVLSELKRIAGVFENANEKTKEIEKKYESAIEAVQNKSIATVFAMEDLVKKYEKAKDQSNQLIMDKELADGVKAYKAVLEATKEVFGDKCTENVITAAIEAGSYTAWRGIMGPKYTIDQQPRKRAL